jgi:hypothetical protein
LALLRPRVSLLICALVAIGCQSNKPTTGALVVTVNGLPGSVPASITVSGPNAFSQQVTQTTTLENLAPGTYTVRSLTVHFSNALYASTMLQELHTITAGHTESVSVPYALASGSIDLSVNGLPTGVGPSVQLTGPNNFGKSVFAAGVIGELPPGAYTLRADTLVNTDGDRFGAVTYQQSITVPASLAPVPASVAYALASGSLAVTVNGLPANLPPPVTVTGPGNFLRQTAVSMTIKGLNAGTYTIAASTASACPNIYTPSATSQTADVAVAATATAAVSFTQSQPPPANLNLKIDGLHLVQIVQDYGGTTPMVAGKPALLRVFGIANQCNTATPKVHVTLSTGRTIDISATDASVRQTPDQGVLVSSWNATLNATDVVPGLSVTAVIDPDNAVAEANESDNSYTKAIDVRTVPTVGIRFVPVNVAGNTGNATDARVDSLLQVSRKIHPAFAYDADVRAPYSSSKAAFTSAGGSWTEVLTEIRALRVADSTTTPTARYYHGIVKVTYNSGVAGIGFVGQPAALSWDYSQSVSEIIAHELGHNYGRSHSPCGNPAGVDQNWPSTGNYVGGFIGSYGYDIASGLLKEPVFFTDIMGYCNNKWISDYTYFGMMAWMIAHPNSLPDVVSAAFQPSLLIWGRIVNGQPVLEPAFELNARAQLPASSGPNRITAVDDAGTEVFSLSFAADQIADLPGDQQTFAFAVPVSMLRGHTLASLKLSARGRTVTNVGTGGVTNAAAVLTRAGLHQVRVQWDAAKFPAVMVRDPVKGDILSFARGGDATIVTDNTQLELVYSNRVHSFRELRILR